MPRKVICIEGREFGGMKTIAMPGSIYIADEDKQIPITINMRGDHKLIGYATNLQRNVFTGQVSMELTIHPKFDVNLQEYTATVTLTDFQSAKAKDRPDVTIINSGRLREVTLLWERPVR